MSQGRLDDTEGRGREEDLVRNLFVGEYEERDALENVLLEKPVELGLGLVNALLVGAVHDENERTTACQVGLPQGTRLLLATKIPWDRGRGEDERALGSRRRRTKEVRARGNREGGLEEGEKEGGKIDNNRCGGIFERRVEGRSKEKEGETGYQTGSSTSPNMMLSTLKPIVGANWRTSPVLI